MARFLEILMSLRKFITKWKEIRLIRPKIQPERINSFGFCMVFNGEVANGHGLPPDKITSVRLSLTFLLTDSLANGSSIQETPNTAVLKQRTIQRIR
ncbi:MULTISPECIES: hypothetical protein [unclassified Rhizobium]|uniref:hypothetical protein n=1 Tax=unclassified Rhizobium TaxID=2613769 RepID=UPI0007EABDB6|nr:MULTISPECIES: hypothetical protein [unclassified Rhizobium]ANK86730.1 hypothetical protein AMK02_CH03181 [Rhizobium sp. N731]ANL16976.1 hypothetical protein AMJ97_CH03179 [Rhizobium sp. N1314]